MVIKKVGEVFGKEGFGFEYGKNESNEIQERGGGKRRLKWWKREELEEVKEAEYLGYRFKRNEGQEAQCRKE